jgi:hypothetical protein
MGISLIFRLNGATLDINAIPYPDSSAFCLRTGAVQVRSGRRIAEAFAPSRLGEAIARIGNRANRSNCAAVLIQNVQEALRKYSDISKLWFLLYPSGLRPEDKARIGRDDAGVLSERQKGSGNPCQEGQFWRAPGAR